MAARADTFDLGRLGLSPGEGRRLDLAVRLPDLTFAGESYEVAPGDVPVRLDVSRMSGQGYSLRLRFRTDLTGPCMRCLGPAQPAFEIDAREVDAPYGGDELRSPYVEDEQLDLLEWARDALALALPTQIVCRDECAGLCPQCGRNLDEEPHEHEREPDPRWGKLRELRLGEG